MNKKTLLFVFLGLIIIAGISLVFKNKTSNDTLNNSPIILFYGTGCPHCVNVEKYIIDNKVQEKVEFQKKEVFNNKNNADLLVEKAKVCGFPTETIGVPFLWDGTDSRCYTGDADVIQYFKDKIGS